MGTGNGTKSSAIYIIWLLGAFALLGLGGCLWLLSQGKAEASVATIVGLIGTALGGLGSMLNRTEKQDDPAPVQVVNPPSKPVPVTEE